MGLFDSMWGGIFGNNDIFKTGYNATEGIPAYQQGADQAGVNQAQAQSQNQIAQQQAFLNALGASGLNANQSGVFGQQQGLANQYAQMAAGQGPNPARNQLAETTGQNIQQQAALMASGRGAQANPGMMARQASQRGGALQQQAAGQAATLGAQQQIAGLQGMQGQYNQMANLATAGVGQQQNALSQLNQQSQNYQQMLQQQLQAQNQNQMQGRLANADIAKQGMQNTAGAVGGGLNAVGSLFSMPSGAGGAGGGGGGGGGGGMGQMLGPLMQAHGGMIPQYYADGAIVSSEPQINYGPPPGYATENPNAIVQQNTANQPKSLLGQSQSPQSNDMQMLAGNNTGANAIFQGVSGFGKAILGGQQKEAGADKMQQDSDKVMEMAPMMAMLSPGGKVNGKAKVKGDSLKNDTVPAMLSPGEIVIPRTAAGDPKKIAAFLNNLLGTNFKHG